MLVLLERDYKIIMKNVVKDLVEKVGNMYEKIENFSGEVEII